MSIGSLTARVPGRRSAIIAAALAASCVLCAAAGAAEQWRVTATAPDARLQGAGPQHALSDDVMLEVTGGGASFAFGPTRAITVLVADGSRIRLIGGDAPRLTLHAGGIRVIHTGGGTAPALLLQLGPAAGVSGTGEDAGGVANPIEFAIRNAEVIIRHVADAEAPAEVIVGRGSLTVDHDGRRIHCRELMVRGVREGRLLGARALAAGDWERAASLFVFPGAVLASRGAVGAAPASSTTASAAEAAAGLVPGAAYVRVTTRLGDFVLELDAVRAPVSTANFLRYVEERFYTGTIFHRVVRGGIFVVQGGGMSDDMQEKKTHDPIVNEWTNGLRNLRGTISMARRPAPDSATSQFFINTRDNESLDQPRGGAAYAVFGRVIHGMEVIDAIQALPTGRRGLHADVPLESVAIDGTEVLTLEQVVALRSGAPE